MAASNLHVRIKENLNFTETQEIEKLGFNMKQSSRVLSIDRPTWSDKVIT